MEILDKIVMHTDYCIVNILNIIYIMLIKKKFQLRLVKLSQWNQQKNS